MRLSRIGEWMMRLAAIAIPIAWLGVFFNLWDDRAATRACVTALIVIFIGIFFAIIDRKKIPRNRA